MNKTKIGIKTAISVVLIALIQGILSFYRISVILSVYGDKINGVVQVALQISAYLVLFQSGMSAAYQFKMYAPLSNEEYGRISSLFSGLQKSMLKVSGKMLLISLIIIPLYSALLVNQGVDYLDTVLILTAIGIRIMAPYYFTLPERCLVDIKEKRYVIITIEGIKDCVTIVTEVLLVKFTALPLPIILCVNLIYLAVTKLIYLRIIRKYYGASFDLKSQPEYVPATLTKAVNTHQISSIATGNTDNVVLSILSSLKNVTIYSAFANLISYPNVVVSRIVEGMRASLALKITRDDESSFTAFKELLAFSFFCICAIVPVFLQMANPFVALWIGQQYCIPLIPLILFGLILTDYLIMPVVYAARDAKGLYVESKNFTIVQAVANVVLSVALVIPFGITGVLIGTFTAAYFILQPFNFKLVYNKVFKRKTTIYLDLIVVAIICVVSYFASGFAVGNILASDNGWVAFGVRSVVCAAIAGVLAFTGLWLTNSGFRKLVRRFFGKRRALPNNI